jgi:hypothetical protein
MRSHLHQGRSSWAPVSSPSISTQAASWFCLRSWLLLAVMLGMRLTNQRDRFAREARSPAAFTGVADTAVLGTRPARDCHAAAAALLAVSGVGWALLVVPSCGTGRPRRPGPPSSSSPPPKASRCWAPLWRSATAPVGAQDRTSIAPTSARVRHNCAAARYDPEAGITCWDERTLAEVRQYERLSAVTGLHALRSAAAGWTLAARSTPEAAVTVHPQFGQLAAADIIRRNAHEAVHHELDIRRDFARGPT